MIVLLDNLLTNPFTIGLTRNELLANAVSFFIAGFQTTSETLLFAFYELAQHPQIQEKVRRGVLRNPQY